MGTRERRERERQETRQLILATARELFATQGIEATTMRAIAERIEYTPTAIYHHFKDKDELILELVHGDFQLLAQAFSRLERIDDPVERLRRLGLAYVDFALEYPHHYRLMFMTTTVYQEEWRGERGNPEEDAYAFLLMVVGECLEAGRIRAGYDDVHELAQVFWAAAHGVVSLQIAKCGDPWVEWRDARTTAGLLIDAVMRGMIREEGT